MSIDFNSPSYRAAQSDLTVAISPLGLVELADEEFEVHGPRLNRYASNWAWYLGHHWGFRREVGEPQLTFNYSKALSDFTTNFTFGRGVNFRSPPETEAIVPNVLRKVWEVDNDKESLLWEIGQLGSVSGDVFIKVAYEDPWVDSIGRGHPGRTRVLPLNPAHCFPEFHPHDRSRMIRFKLKYRFWGTAAEGTRQVFCLDGQTELLTDRGWRKWNEVEDDEQFLTINPDTKVIEWQSHSGVHVFDWCDDLVRWKGRGIDALSTPNHRWLTAHRDRNGDSHWDSPGRFLTTEELRAGHRNKQIITGGGTPLCFATHPTFSDEFVELIGWAVTEGHYQKPPAKTGVVIAQSETANPEKIERIRRLVKHFADQGASAREMDTHRQGKYAGCRDFYFGRGIGEHLRRVAPDRKLTPEFLCALTLPQADLLYDTLLAGDGHRHVRPGRTVEQEFYVQKSFGMMADFQMLAGMLGKRTAAESLWSGTALEATVYHSFFTTNRRLEVSDEHYEGVVWCPSVPNKTVLARRNGCVYWTGQTYTELITDTGIEEYVNDELIDQRENPLGEIPVVHIPNVLVSGSPWGLSDIADITPLNREYNEKATDISDIINYHAAPVTVITGAKASQLEKGPKKVWGGLPEKANVFNLELGGNLATPLEYLQLLKTAMHEMTGVPETALGQLQPISNTSGVAIALQYQSMMQKYRQKTIRYGLGFQRVNELVMLTLAIKEPEALVYDPTYDEPLKEFQLTQLDPADPITYQSTCHWPPPLPIDQLVALNEIQAKMALGLESKTGALRDLGFEFPGEKLQEIFDELVEDAKQQGALDLLKSQIMASVAMLTGMVPGPQGPEMASAGGPDVNSAGAPGGGGPLPGVGMPGPPGEQQKILNDLVTQAFGTKLAQRRNPENNGD